MPRTNIEEMWWSDRRRKAFTRLVGDEYLADGLAANFWRLALEFCTKGNRMVPLKFFKLIPHYQDFADCDLAAITGEWVYVRGSSKVNEWLISRARASALGVQARANHVVTTKQPSGDHEETTRLTSVSVSKSVSKSKSENQNTLAEAAAPAVAFDKFDEFYRKYPKKERKRDGERIFRREIKTPEAHAELERALANYLEELAQKYPRPEERHKFTLQFATFMGRWREKLEVSRPEPAPEPEWKRKAREEEAAQDALRNL